MRIDIMISGKRSHLSRSKRFIVILLIRYESMNFSRTLNSDVGHKTATSIDH